MAPPWCGSSSCAAIDTILCSLTVYPQVAVVSARLSLYTYLRPCLHGQILLVTGGWAITDVNSKGLANTLHRLSDQHNSYQHIPEIPDKEASSGSNHEPHVYL